MAGSLRPLRHVLQTRHPVHARGARVLPEHPRLLCLGARAAAAVNHGGGPVIEIDAAARAPPVHHLTLQDGRGEEAEHRRVFEWLLGDGRGEGRRVWVVQGAQRAARLLLLTLPDQLRVSPVAAVVAAPAAAPAASPRIARVPAPRALPATRVRARSVRRLAPVSALSSRARRRRHRRRERARRESPSPLPRLPRRRPRPWTRRRRAPPPRSRPPRSRGTPSRRLPQPSRRSAGAWRPGEAGADLPSRLIHPPR
mmetsp:Transcript_11056/g.46063  ORF Transcript_11056/g.46063 Transcript_11056/m.46063 type:complete len:254 (-) Transcript_11056:2372-3133(-)